MLLKRQVINNLEVVLLYLNRNITIYFQLMQLYDQFIDVTETISFISPQST